MCRSPFGGTTCRLIRRSRSHRAAVSTLSTLPRLRKSRPSRSRAASTTCTSPLGAAEEPNRRRTLGNVIDTQTNEIAWTFSMSPSPSPMAISAKADGSSDKIYAQNGKDNGFAVVDFATHAHRQFARARVAPTTGIVASGMQGGPFSPSSFSYTLGATSPSTRVPHTPRQSNRVSGSASGPQKLLSRFDS